MSLGLLGEYASDSSPSPPSEDNSDHHHETEPCLTHQSSTDEASSEASASAHSRSFFDGQFGEDTSDSSSGSSEEDEGEGEEAKVTAASEPSQAALPLPDLLPAMAHTGLPQPSTAGSVFSNPYKEAEEARLAVLRHHVKLTPAEMPESKRQRRPRFARSRKQPTTTPTATTSEECFFDEHDSSIKQQQHKRVRAGLPEGLVPAKKYMKSHRRLQETERPWTLQK